MTRLPSVAYAASSAAITDGLPPAVCLLASRLAFAYKQSTGLFASQLSLRERGAKIGVTGWFRRG